jgi:hypothetical protein
MRSESQDPETTNSDVQIVAAELNGRQCRERTQDFGVKQCASAYATSVRPDRDSRIGVARTMQGSAAEQQWTYCRGLQGNHTIYEWRGCTLVPVTACR